MRASSPFGTLLRRYRLAAKLSQEALAERARMSSNGISALERGDRRTPQRETLALLTRALSLDPDQRREFEAAAVRSKLLRPGDRRASSLAERTVDGPVTGNDLPRQLTSFVGRDEVVAEVAALVQRSQLVTLFGSAGIGKTRVSLQVGVNVLDRFNDGVWFVELAPLSNSEYLPITIAQAMDITLGNQGAPLDLLVNAIGSKRALLVVDNCEHLVEPAGRAIAAILRGCPQIRVLASSRQRLGISGEATYRIPSLAMPPALGELTAAEAGRYAATTLFVERAAAVDDRFLLDDENAPVTGDICRRLDGIPLAIELAAARITILSPRQLRDRLDERFHLLSGGRRDVLPRHQTLRAAIDWSYDLLNERERALLRRLSVFANGFTLEGAVALGGSAGLDELDVFDLLASLIDQSLALVEPGGERYRMLESTRAYAHEKLEAAGELPASVSRHLRHLRDLFTAARTHWEKSGRVAEIDVPLIVQLDDVRAALDHVAESADLQMGAELLAAIEARWVWIGLAGGASCASSATFR